MATKEKRKTVIGPEMRVTYCYIAEPRTKDIETGKDLDEPQYEFQGIIDLESLDADGKASYDDMIVLAKNEKAAHNGEYDPDDYNSPIKKGNEINAKRYKTVYNKAIAAGKSEEAADTEAQKEVRHEIKDRVVINFKGGKFPIGICEINPGAAPKPVLDPKKSFYSGMYGRPEVNVFWYNFKGKVGVSFGVNNFMKTRDGEPLGGRKDATKIFGAVSAGAKPIAKKDNSKMFGKGDSDGDNSDEDVV